MAQRYERLTDKSMMKIIGLGLEIAPEIAKNAYKRLYELEEMIVNGSLKFVQEKPKKENK